MEIVDESCRPFACGITDSRRVNARTSKQHFSDRNSSPKLRDANLWKEITKKNAGVGHISRLVTSVKTQQKPFKIDYRSCRVF